jgi:peptidoglycan hydrolase CwlO-like protein
MNNTTFVMGVVLTMLILFLALSAHAVEAADMGDVTLQVLESNDPSGIINDIELPDARDIDKYDSKREIEEHIGETQNEIENDIDEITDDIDDSIDEAEVDKEDPPDEDH